MIRLQTPQPLQEQMAQGPVVGVINLIPSPLILEQLCAVPFDFVWMDMEHGPATVHDLGVAVGICLGREITPLVRVPCIEDWAVKWVLDQGARGVVFPFVNSVEDARAAISASRYPPDGHRGFFPDVAANRWGADPFDYAARANDEICVVLQIEHENGVDSVEEIAALDGWDVLFVGPMDLSASYGKLGQVDDPEVSEAIDRVRQAARDARGFAGILDVSPEGMKRRIDEGFDFVAVSPDVRIIRLAISSYWEDIQRAIG